MRKLFYSLERKISIHCSISTYWGTTVGSPILRLRIFSSNFKTIKRLCCIIFLCHNHNSKLKIQHFSVKGRGLISKMNFCSLPTDVKILLARTTSLFKATFSNTMAVVVISPDSKCLKCAFGFVESQIFQLISLRKLFSAFSAFKAKTATFNGK